MPVTLRDIAKRLNLSHATVSFVLNERHDVAIPSTTRQRVWDAAREMGYRPNRAARALVKGKTQMLALWMPSPRQSFYGQVFRALYRHCREAGYDVIFCDARFDGGAVTPLDWPVDGILGVDIAPLLSQTEVPDYMPIVTIGAFSDERHDHVLVDLESGAVQAVSHLLEVGCRRVAHLTANQQLDDPHGRNAAYHKVVRAAGRRPELILLEDGDRATARATVADYVGKHGAPDGLFCYNDWIALAAYRGLVDAGVKVPESCRIVGFDGSEELEYTAPSISTVVQPVEDMTRLGFEFLIERIADMQRSPQTAVLRTELVVRESSA